MRRRVQQEAGHRDAPHRDLLDVQHDVVALRQVDLADVGAEL